MNTGKVLIISAACIDVWMRCASPKIYIVDELPGGFNALCLPPVGIYIKRGFESEALLLHELKHWQQSNSYGVLYYLLYGLEYMLNGYDMMPMEMEARMAAGETGYAILNYTDAVRRGMSVTVYNPNFRK